MRITHSPPEVFPVVVNISDDDSLSIEPPHRLADMIVQDRLVRGICRFEAPPVLQQHVGAKVTVVRRVKHVIELLKSIRRGTHGRVRQNHLGTGRSVIKVDDVTEKVHQLLPILLKVLMERFLDLRI